jgi:N-carbamoylputrescine amidase
MKNNNQDLLQKFTAGLIQISMEKDINHNLEKAAAWVIKAAGNGAKVICLPELFRSQYFCQKENIDYFNLAETIPGPSTQALGKIAKEKKIVLIVPLF